MTDNIRQEAINAVDRERIDGLPPMANIEWAIDASGLIEQLAEAIAQRDATARLYVLAEQATLAMEEQLAAERALCDRLADNLRAQKWPSEWCESLADYDAARATKRADG